MGRPEQLTNATRKALYSIASAGAGGIDQRKLPSNTFNALWNRGLIEMVGKYAVLTDDGLQAVSRSTGETQSGRKVEERKSTRNTNHVNPKR